jgi:hypothetical protein
MSPSLLPVLACWSLIPVFGFPFGFARLAHIFIHTCVDFRTYLHSHCVASTPVLNFRVGPLRETVKPLVPSQDSTDTAERQRECSPIKRICSPV